MEYRYKLAALANTYFMNDFPCHVIAYLTRINSNLTGAARRRA
jgi:hypothetical protein